MGLDRDDVKKIRRGMRDELHNLFSRFGGGDDNSDDPSDYTRSTKIEDGDALMMLSEMEHLRRRGDRAMAEAKAIMAQHESVRTRLFHKLEDVYPMTAGLSPAHDFSRWSFWKGQYWFMSKDKTNAAAEQTDTNTDSQAQGKGGDDGPTGDE